MQFCYSVAAGKKILVKTTFKRFISMNGCIGNLDLIPLESSGAFIKTDKKQILAHIKKSMLRI